MTKKILCATDGTGHSERAVHQAASMAQKLGAELILCVVNVVQGGRAPHAHAFTDQDVETMRTTSVDIAKRAGFAAPEFVIIEARDPATAIVQYAEGNGCDHIVTGTGDKHGITRLVLGSVAAEVANKAGCSVTVAR